MITVNKKLQFIANLIHNANKVIDVGSDHALLAVYLLTNKLCNHVYNLDINLEPLNQGIKNCETHQVISQTTNLVSNGLEAIKEEINADYIVIAGMGGNNIIDIVSNIPNNVQWNNLILSPNNNVPKLRAFIHEQNWCISLENVIEDNNTYYQVIVVNKSKGLKITNELEIYFGTYNLKYQTENFKLLHTNRINHIKKNHLDQLNERYKKELKLLYEVIK
ncbi:MAG: class I SAM-dependent methyltransferase [Mycoplasma sp.]